MELLLYGVIRELSLFPSWFDVGAGRFAEVFFSSGSRTIAEEKIARPRLSENQVRFWLTRFRKLDPNVKSHRETLINTFVNAVYLYDEKVLIAFNYKDGTKTITFDEIAAKDAPAGNGSDLVNFAP